MQNQGLTTRAAKIGVVLGMIGTPCFVAGVAGIANAEQPVRQQQVSHVSTHGSSPSGVWIALAIGGGTTDLIALGMVATATPKKEGRTLE